MLFIKDTLSKAVVRVHQGTPCSFFCLYGHICLHLWDKTLQSKTNSSNRWEHKSTLQHINWYSPQPRSHSNLVSLNSLVTPKNNILRNHCIQLCWCQHVYIVQRFPIPLKAFHSNGNGPFCCHPLSFLVEGKRQTGS